MVDPVLFVFGSHVLYSRDTVNLFGEINSVHCSKNCVSTHGRCDRSRLQGRIHNVCGTHPYRLSRRLIGVIPPTSHIPSWYLHTFQVLAGADDPVKQGQAVNWCRHWSSRRRMRSIKRPFLACSMESRSHSA